MSRELLIHIACATAIVLSGVVHFAAQTSPLDQFADLAGCWEKRDDASGQLLSEHWMSPAGGVMLGMGRTVKNGIVKDWEYMRIEQRSDGIYFVARPRAASEETAFKFKPTTGRQFTFENLTHDFPQRVIYAPGNDRLNARAEGADRTGKIRGIDFAYVRVRCR